MAQAIQPLSLYELTEELRLLEQDLLESGGEITPDMETLYGELLEMHASKVEGYVALIQKFSASALAIKAEADRLAEHL